MTTHYDQFTNGWNGFTTLAEFYDKFSSNDKRLGGEYDGYPNDANKHFTKKTHMNAGFLIGKQYKTDGSELDVEFTRDFPNGFALADRGQGIRVMKYLIDGEDHGQAGDEKNTLNDYAVLRYADVLLMYAEAVLRGGTETVGTALERYNELRRKRITGYTDVATVTLDDILDERGRELYWEGWRRPDLLRFNKFLNPTSVRKATSDKTKSLFPIPATALSTNPNLTQNPGY